jgi:nicotinamidase-related amidase
MDPSPDPDIKTALLLVDIQNDYFPKGKMELQGSPEAAGNASLLLAACRKRGTPVIHVQHISMRSGAGFFIPGSPGAAIHPCVAPAGDEPVIVKNYTNSFRKTSLLSELQSRGVQDLIIAGMMTHMCIDTTVRAAAEMGFYCVLAGDACATRDLVWEGRTVPARDVQAAFLASLQAGLFADVMKTGDILADDTLWNR